MLGDADRCEPGEVSRGKGPLPRVGPPQGVPLVNAPEQGRVFVLGLRFRRFLDSLSQKKKKKSCVDLAPPDLSVFTVARGTLVAAKDLLSVLLKSGGGTRLSSECG